ncbi:MAG: hypothetical protein QOF46_1772 [Paraburkholderia sp.]|jgi:hypothetical protein|nr:hypothetical protein [Paraburkholderia sp.]
MRNSVENLDPAILISYYKRRRLRSHHELVVTQSAHRKTKLNIEVFRGSRMNMDEDIAHVARVMAPSLRAFRGEPVLAPAYWRKRLQRIQDEFPLTAMQTFQIKHLLGELDRFEAERGTVTSSAGPS